MMSVVKNSVTASKPLGLDFSGILLVTTLVVQVEAIGEGFVKVIEFLYTLQKARHHFGRTRRRQGVWVQFRNPCPLSEI